VASAPPTKEKPKKTSVPKFEISDHLLSNESFFSKIKSNQTVKLDTNTPKKEEKKKPKDGIIIHEVKYSDTLPRLALMYGVDVCENMLCFVCS